MLVSSLLSDPHTPLVLLLSWLVMGLAFLSPPWVLLLVFLMLLLLLKWFTIFFPFVSLLLTTPVLSNLTLLVLLFHSASRRPLLRCDSPGPLYTLRLPAS